MRFPRLFWLEGSPFSQARLSQRLLRRLQLSRRPRLSLVPSRSSCLGPLCLLHQSCQVLFSLTNLYHGGVTPLQLGSYRLPLKLLELRAPIGPYVPQSIRVPPARAPRSVQAFAPIRPDPNGMDGPARFPGARHFPGYITSSPHYLCQSISMACEGAKKVCT